MPLRHLLSQFLGHGRGTLEVGVQSLEWWLIYILILFDLILFYFLWFVYCYNCERKQFPAGLRIWAQFVIINPCWKLKYFLLSNVKLSDIFHTFLAILFLSKTSKITHLVFPSSLHIMFPNHCLKYNFFLKKNYYMF